jgi:UDP-N-acetylmuramate--alanine ligase
MKSLKSPVAVNVPDNIERVYFLGIGGIGMSALARYFNTTGKHVAGYDRTSSDLTRQLTTEGIDVHYKDAPEQIPEPFRQAGNTLVVFTPAIPPDHRELAFFRERDFIIYKRSQILGYITRQQKAVAVAGTHGKTTISTMIAFLLAKAGTGCNAFLGGISKNFKSNLVLQAGSEWVVTEADEFDRSFLQLYPFAGIVTAMDPDHLDIYGDAVTMIDAFNLFISQIDREGLLIIKKGLPADAAVMPARTFTYALKGEGDFHAENIRLVNSRYCFDLAGPGIRINDLSLEHPGIVNVENAVAATAMAVMLGIDHDRIRSALEVFSGIQRRFDYQIKSEKIVYIDDYAHHPAEIEATLLSVRELYPDRKITGIFQPHLYTRTRDLADGFAKSLNLLDRLILLDIYPARELPMEGVTSDMIFKKVTIREKVRCTKDKLLQFLGQSEVDVLITLGAGDIDTFVEPIREILLKKQMTE